MEPLLKEIERISGPLSADELRQVHAWWRAANYLALGMIYLQDNPFLKEPLKPQHIKHRLLGHRSEHPNGLKERDFDSLFTTDKPIIFNFHGYPWLIHKLAYRFKNHVNLHVRGYPEVRVRIGADRPAEPHGSGY